MFDKPVFIFAKKMLIHDAFPVIDIIGIQASESCVTSSKKKKAQPLLIGNK
jgi:hypothetical protein